MFLIQTSHKAAQKLREDYFAKLQRLPPAFYDRHPIGDLMALATNDVEAVRFALGPGLLVFADAVFLFTALPPAMLWLSPKFALLAFAPMVTLPFFIIYIDKLIQARFAKVQEQFSKLSSFAQENIEGIKIIKSFVREWTQLNRFSSIGKEFVQLNLRLAFVQSFFDPLFLLTVSLGFVSLLIFGGRDVISGAVGIGTFVAFQRYLDNLAWPMMAFGMATTHYQRGKTSLNRIFEVLSEPELAQTEFNSPIEYSNSAPLIEARNLCFRYGDSTKYALKNVSFKIAQGSHVALVGPIGSGKSTLMRILSGQYEIEPGMIFWKGVDIAKIPLSLRRKALGLVPQETFLFSESLRWNVSMGAHRDNEDIYNALAQAGLQNEAAQWGLEAQIGERGLNLSGGQRSRVTIARAILRSSELLILDDALSSIDAQTESKILDTFSRHSNQTLLMITHRFARLWKFDQILVLKDGTLTQNGPPSNLAEAPGLYRELLNLQMMESALGGQ